MRILIIDDEATARYALARTLKKDDVQIIEAENGETGLQRIVADSPDLVFLDLSMPVLDGLAMLEQLQSKSLTNLPEITVITGNDSIEQAVACIRRGATDFITKPYDVEHVRLIVTRLRKRLQLQQRVAELQSQLESAPGLGPLVGASHAMTNLFEQIPKAANNSLPVLIRGESGTGKELVAQLLHQKSPRAKKPFIAVNTAAISESLIESELFGHTKGAFTGADKSREGVFRKADGGTLFLDEIGDMPLGVQTRLLRVLQEGIVQPVGSEESVSIDVRIISATHQDLEEAISENHFRSDLYYRLRGIELRLPPLRTRREDIILLSNQWLKPDQFFSQATITTMMNYAWPGNVRELKQRVEAASAMASSVELTINDLGITNSPDSNTTATESDGFPADLLQLPLTEAKQVLGDRFEKFAITRALKDEQFNVSAAARRLGIHRQSLQQKMKTLDISAHDKSS